MNQPMDLEGGEEVNQDDLLSRGRPRARAAELAIQVFCGCDTLVPVCAVGSTGEMTAAIRAEGEEAHIVTELCGQIMGAPRHRHVHAIDGAVQISHGLWTRPIGVIKWT
jgi:hypothetical protein